MKSIKTIIILGVLFGVLTIFSPASLFSLAFILLVAVGIHKFSDAAERNLLIRFFLIAVAIRFFLVLLSKFILGAAGKWTYLESYKSATLFGDTIINTIVGWWYTLNAMGEPLGDYSRRVVSTGSLGDYGRSGYMYLIALFYRAFGYSPISVIFNNCILGALNGIVYYSIAKSIGGLRAARITAILVIFFPSLILWSIANLKDTIFIFLTGVVLWSALRLSRRFRMKFLISLILALALQYFIRDWIIVPSVIVISFYLFFKRLKKLNLLLLVLILCSFIPVFMPRIDTVKSRLVDYHRGVISSGGNTYKLYEDWVYYPNSRSGGVTYPAFLRGYIRGWLHFLLEPLPWKVYYSKPFLIASPQMLIWYLLLPLSLSGILMQLRYNWRESLPLVMYIFIIGSILVFTGGNIGTAFRFRDILTPLILLFASIGLVGLLNYEKNSIFVKHDR